MEAVIKEPAELAVMSCLLDLDEFEVVDLVQDRGRRVRTFTIVPRTAVGLCPHCRGICDERHLCRDRVVTDLPMSGWRTELIARLWQFRCRTCDRFFTPGYGALAEGAHASERLLQRLAELIDRSDISSASAFFGLPEKTVQDWYYEHVKRQQSQLRPQLEPVRSLGIDELSLKKDTGSSAAF
jgi:transposase